MSNNLPFISSQLSILSKFYLTRSLPKYNSHQLKRKIELINSIELLKTFYLDFILNTHFLNL